MSVKRRIHDLNAKGILDLRRLHQHSTDLELVIAAIECLKDDSSDESDDSDASDEELLIQNSNPFYAFILIMNQTRISHSITFASLSDCQHE